MEYISENGTTAHNEVAEKVQVAHNIEKNVDKKLKRC